MFYTYITTQQMHIYKHVQSHVIIILQQHVSTASVAIIRASH